MKALVKLAKVNLQPGQLHLARNPTNLQTILGSCVGVTFWSERFGAGALCHGVLPRCPQPWPFNATASEGHRYVDFSIRELIRRFDALGVRRQELQVKVFGGADVLPIQPARISKPTVGGLNARVALEVLEEEGMIVLASDLGGIRGRRIQFNTGTGEVFVHKLGAWSDPQ